MTNSIFRFFPRDILRTATVKHVGTSAGRQGYSATADETMVGAFSQLTRYQRALMGGDLRNKWLFFVDDDAVIHESDLVTIDSVIYKVANVDTYAYGTMQHKAALLTTP